jgi:nucleotide-binding universal stress UspA family protein
MLKHRILIPLDGSHFSQQILSQIRRFLNPAETEFILLRVAPLPEGMVGMPARPAAVEWPVSVHPSHQDAEMARHPIYASQVWAGQEARVKDELWEAVAYLRQAGYTVSVEVKFGEPAKEILDFIEDEKIDLVAMTTHGRTGLKRFIFGSVAEAVLRRSPVPVMVMRPIE